MSINISILGFHPRANVFESVRCVECLELVSVP